jgi:short-subunit dehydrogenase
MHRLITGASSGIGRALVARWARPGTLLSLQGRDPARLEEAAAAAALAGAEVDIRSVDVRDTGALAAWASERDAARPVDMVVANAGIAGNPGVSGTEIMAVNAVGKIATVEPLLPRMAARRQGHVVLVSSLASFLASPTGPAYAASKAAVRRYGEGLRPRLARDGVQLSVVCPGFVDTPLTRVNRFPMPFLMDAERAAEIIDAGLQAGRARIAFPLPTYLLARFMGLMPAALRDPILMRQTPKE